MYDIKKKMQYSNTTSYICEKGNFIRSLLESSFPNGLNSSHFVAPNLQPFISQGLPDVWIIKRMNTTKNSNCFTIKLCDSTR